MMRIFLSGSEDSSHVRDAIDSWRSSCRVRRIVIGCVDCSTHEFQLCGDWQASRVGASDLYVSDMAVHPAFQGLGLGRRLLGACLEYAAGRAYTDVFLHVEERNRRAQALYLSEGFSVAEGLDTAKLDRALGFGPACPNLLMHKRLAGPHPAP